MPKFTFTFFGPLLTCARGGGEQILATLSIVTNSLLVGFTSYGLYFYFPDMSIVESLWYVPARTALRPRPVLAKPRATLRAGRW